MENATTIVWIMIFSIPLVAIIGGIVAGIVRTLGRQRLVELAQRERITAIELGLDLSKLPPLPPLADPEEMLADSCCFPHRQKHRSQALLVGGLVTLAAGIAVSIMLGVLEPDEPVYVVGVVPGAIGVALLLSAWIVRPRPENGHGPRSGERQ